MILYRSRDSNETSVANWHNGEIRTTEKQLLKHNWAHVFFGGRNCGWKKASFAELTYTQLSHVFSVSAMLLANQSIHAESWMDLGIFTSG